MTQKDASAEAVINRLGLQPHPEGGFYREIFRDEPDDGSRGAATSIYFLLKAGQRSHWHRVDAIEIWHFHAGAPLLLSIANSDTSRVTSMTLGADILAGHESQAVVPVQAWQAAECVSADENGWSLVGCTVAPAFSFDGFEMAPEGWSPSSR